MALNALNKMLKSGGGLLVGERQTEQAANNNGLAAPATSPLGLSTLGVNPDAAKMGGTSQQKMAANKQSLAATPQDTAQVVISEADKKSRKQAQSVQNLQQTGSSLDSRVNNIVASRIKEQTSQNTVGNTATGLVNAASLPDDVSKGLFTTFLNSGGKEIPGWTNEQYEKLAKDLGIIAKDAVINTTSGAQDIKNKLKTEYFNPKTGKMTLAINNSVTVGNIKQQAAAEGKDWANELGFDNEEALAEFLGVPVSELDAKSVKDLNDGIDSQVSKVFSQTAAQQAILNDPSSSDLERQQAEAALGQLSGRGVIAGEQEASKGAEGLRQAETVAFNGKEYKLEDLVQSQEFKDTATKYYDLTPQQRAELKAKAPATEKELYGWLDKNEELLKTIETDTGKTLDLAQADTTAAAGAYGLLSGAIKDAKKLEQLTGLTGPTKFGDKKKTPTTKFGQMIESLASMGTDPRAKAQIEALSQFLNDAPAEYIDLLKDKGIDWFKQNNLWSENQSPDELKNKLTRWMWKRNDIGFLDGDKDVSQFGIPMEEYQDLVSTLATLGENSELQQIFDANKDGQLDSSKDINTRIKDRYGATIRSDNPDTPTLGEILGDLRGKAASVYPPMVKDKNIDENEANAFMPSSFEQLDKILRAAPNTGDGTKRFLANKLSLQRPEVKKITEASSKQMMDFSSPEELEAYATDIVNNYNSLKKGNIHPLERPFIDSLEASLGQFLKDKDYRKSILEQEREGQKAKERQVEKEQEEARKSQAESDRNLANRVTAGLEDPLGAVKSIPVGLNNTINKAGDYIAKRNPLKKKVKF
jgi:hypothetical protein